MIHWHSRDCIVICDGIHTIIVLHDVCSFYIDFNVSIVAVVDVHVIIAGVAIVIVVVVFVFVVVVVVVIVVVVVVVVVVMVVVVVVDVVVVVVVLVDNIFKIFEMFSISHCKSHLNSINLLIVNQSKPFFSEFLEYCE